MNMNTNKPEPTAIGLSIGIITGVITCVLVEVFGFGDAFVHGEIGMRRLTAIFIAIGFGVLMLICAALFFGSNYLERMQKAREMDRIQNGNDLW